MKRLKEILFIIGVFILFLVPSALFGQWWLFSVFMVFGIIFGLLEWLATIKTGKTVSQQFWALKEKSPIKAWIILASMLGAWILLLCHLGLH